MKRNRGFTLIELIVVIAILAVLVGVAQPAYNKVIESAERSVCMHQMSQMRRLYYAHLVSFPDSTLAGALAGSYPDIAENFALHECPSGGEYIEDENGHIACTVHGSLDIISMSTDGTGTGIETFAGSNLRVYNNYWPQPEDYADNPNKSIWVEPGGVFEYDGIYYVVTRRLQLTKDQAADGPGGVAWTWYATQELTGNVLEFPEGTTQINGVSRGDIVCIGDEQYVIFDDGGEWAWNPNDPNRQWYEIPNDWDEENA